MCAIELFGTYLDFNASVGCFADHARGSKDPEKKQSCARAAVVESSFKVETCGTKRNYSLQGRCS